MILKINPEFHLDIGNITDVGRVREKNEDYLETFESAFGNVFIVCDGMGGHIAGEIASRLAVATIKEYIISNPEKISNTKQIIRNALQLANIKIIEKWNDDPQLRGMGTTIVILIIRSNVAYYAHVGDSRIYLVRKKKIYQLTKDHSFVQNLVDGGLISYKDAETHPRKNEITQALGISDSIKIDLNEIGLNLYKDDTFLLCTDGLTGLVEDEIIQNIVIKNDAQDSCTKLVSLANNNGGHDNITIQIIRVINGVQISKDKENVPPSGALNKNIHSVSRTHSASNKFENTREIPSFNNNSGNKKKKMMSIYFGLVGLIILFVALTFVFIKKDSGKGIVKNDTVNVETKSITSYKLKTFQSLLENYFKEFVTRNNINDIKISQSIEIDKFNFRDSTGHDNINFDLKKLKTYFENRNINYLHYCEIEDSIKIHFKALFSNTSGKEIKFILKGNIENDRFKLTDFLYEKNKSRSESIKLEEDQTQKNEKEQQKNDNKANENKSRDNKQLKTEKEKYGEKTKKNVSEDKPDKDNETLKPKDKKK